MNITEEINEGFLDFIEVNGLPLSESEKYWKPLIALARQGLRLQQKENEGRSCSVCAWTNHGCLNLGNPNEKPKWVCHGCIKRGFDQLFTLQNSLEAAKRDTERLLKCCDLDANGNPVTRGSTLYLYPGNDVTREPMTLKVAEQTKYCWHNSIEQAQAAINAERKEKL